MLLVDDDDVLPAVPDEGEAILLAQLEPDALLAIDAAIFDQTRQHWLKVARVVHGAIETGHFPIEDSVVDLHARRVIQLVHAKVLEAQGNLHKPRWSEVRGPSSPPRQVTGQMPSFSSRIEVRLEPTGQDTVRLVLDDVHASGTRVLFTSAELPLKDVLEGTFSPD